MIFAGDFRNGTTFEMDSQVYRVVEFQHVKPGKGAAFVRTKLKNVIVGTTMEKTFNPSEKVEEVSITTSEMQYLYNDGETYTFMDNNTYEQVELNKDSIEDILPYLLDNMNVKVLSYKGNIFGVEPPTFVELEVTYTEPGIKGATATGSTKPATVETGASFQVPLFVEIGDKIRIDTRTGEYMERV
jgi:elongation factor P